MIGLSGSTVGRCQPHPHTIQIRGTAGTRRGSSSDFHNYVSTSVAAEPLSHNKQHQGWFVPFPHNGFNYYKGNREALRSVLPRSRHLRLRKMWSSSVLPLLHQNEGAVRAEVLRRLPGGARQGAGSAATVPPGWRPVVLARPQCSGSFIFGKVSKSMFDTFITRLVVSETNAGKQSIPTNGVYWQPRLLFLGVVSWS